jgi:hypothetical protein
MPFDQTPRQPQAHPPENHDQVQGGQDVGFADSLTGESGDPIWEPQSIQAEAGRPEPGRSEAGRAERARRAGREPEGKLPAGRIIDLEQTQRAAPPASR